MDNWNLGLRQAPTNPFVFVATALATADLRGSTFDVHRQHECGLSVSNREQWTLVPIDSPGATLYLLFKQNVALKVPLPRKMLPPINDLSFLGLQAFEPTRQSTDPKLKPSARPLVSTPAKLVPIKHRPTLNESPQVADVPMALWPPQLQRLHLVEKHFTSPLPNIVSYCVEVPRPPQLHPLPEPKVKWLRSQHLQIPRSRPLPNPRVITVVKLQKLVALPPHLSPLGSRPTT